MPKFSKRYSPHRIGGEYASLNFRIQISEGKLGSDPDFSPGFVMPLERSGGQAQFIVHEPPANDGSSIGRLMIWIEQNLFDDLSLPDLAREAAMSVRTLSRNFRAQARITPAEWIARTRVRRAQRLLETTRLDMEQVAADCGFGSAAVLRQHFAAVVGTNPVAYRRAFSRPSGSRL
jgi:transcriptional regulator GlxA family with amidase domain